MPEINFSGEPEVDAILCLSLKHLARVYLPGDWHAYAKVEASLSRYFAVQLGWKIAAASCPEHRGPFIRTEQGTPSELIESFFAWAYGTRETGASDGQPAENSGATSAPTDGAPSVLSDAVPRVGNSGQAAATSEPVPEVRFPRELLTEDYTRDVCAICQHNPRAQELIVRTPCLCVFHDTCLARCLQSRTTCPTHVDINLVNVPQDVTPAGTNGRRVAIANDAPSVQAAEPRAAGAGDASVNAGGPRAAAADDAPADNSARANHPDAFQPVRRRSRSRAREIAALRTREANAQAALDAAAIEYQ